MAREALSDAPLPLAALVPFTLVWTTAVTALALAGGEGGDRSTFALAAAGVPASLIALRWSMNRRPGFAYARIATPLRIFLIVVYFAAVALALAADEPLRDVALILLPLGFFYHEWVALSHRPG